MALAIGDAEQVPEDFFEVVGVGDGNDQHAGGAEDAVDLAQCAERVRDVLEHLNDKREVVRAVRERDALRNILDQHVASGELGRDVDALIAYVGWEIASQAAVARADVEHGGAGKNTRQPGCFAEAHVLFARGAPAGPGTVEISEVSGSRRSSVRNGDVLIPLGSLRAGEVG